VSQIQLKTLLRQPEKKLLEENVLDITRNFDHRVKAFRKHILLAENSSMKVKYYQDRTEFQSRGKALILCIFHKYKQIDFTGNAHIHGSAWSDFEKLEKSIQDWSWFSKAQRERKTGSKRPLMSGKFLE
jgi:hypothetical protein